MLRTAKAKTGAYAFYTLIAAMSLIPVNGAGLYDGCSVACRLSYPFLHANIFHALCNLFVLHQCLLFPTVRWHTLTMCYLIGISYPFATDIPIVGLSGAVYALFGCIAPYVNNRLSYHSYVIAGLLLSLVIPFMAFGVHAWGYALGLAWGYLNAPICKDR